MPAFEAINMIDGVKNIGPLIASAGLASAAKFCAVRVQEGEEGLIYRSGRAIRPKSSPFFYWALQGLPYGSVSPGIYYNIPGYQNVVRISTQNQKTELHPFHHDVTERDGTTRQRQIASFLHWGIVKRCGKNKVPIDHGEPYTNILIRAHCDFGPGKLEETVANIASDGLETILDGDSDIAHLDKERVKNDLVDLCGQKLFDKCGVDIRDWGVLDRGYTPADISRDGLRRRQAPMPPVIEGVPDVGAPGVQHVQDAGNPDTATVFYLQNFQGDVPS